MKCNMLIISVLACALTACSVKTSGGLEGSPLSKGGDGNYEHKVQGPEVEGTWLSDCTRDNASGNYRQKKVIFAKQNLTRIDNQYRDSGCTLPAVTQELQGLFRWEKPTDYGGYVINYKLELGGGWETETKEEVLLENNLLYLSDFRVGMKTMDRSFPLKKEGSKQEPEPTPEPSPATCPNLEGNYSYNGYYNSIVQKKCEELHWQPTSTDFKPLGEPTVYPTDGAFHYVDGSYLRSYYNKDSWFLELEKSDGSYVLEFRVVTVKSVCGEVFDRAKTVLFRTGTRNGVYQENYCAYWLKY